MSILASCPNNTNSAKVVTVAETKLNVSYGKDSLQKMDIYLPAGRSTDATKAIVLIHGGGWNAGSKSDFAHYIDVFKKRLPDYAIFNINYRLANNTGNRFPTQENDVKSAVDFITDHAAEYIFNKDKMVLLGASAGAHLALLQGYKYSDPKIKAVIDFFGPTDFMAMYNHPWHPMIPYLMQMLMGASPAANAAIYKDSSPINFVTSTSAPTLILQGGSDKVVDPSQSKLLDEKLQKVGVIHELVIYPKEGHGWYGANMNDSFDRIIAFLNKNVQ